MDSTKTYAVGNGEITLSARDADELRKLLMFDYIESLITDIVKEDPDYFRFNSEKNSPRFCRELAEGYGDYVNVEDAYEETLRESVEHYYRHYMGVGDDY